MGGSSVFIVFVLAMRALPGAEQQALTSFD